MSVVYKKLEDVCEILDSRRVPITAKDRKAGAYPYYGANGLQDYVADYIFDDELVLLAEDGGNFGSKERPIAYRVSGKCWVNNHAHVLKAKPNMHVDYLCYALMFYDTEGLVNGATRQKLTQAAMRQMVIPYRDMTEQLQIIEKISQIVRAIEKRKEELQLLDQLVKSRFIELFGDPLIEEDRYPRVPLGSLAEVGSSKRIFEKEYVSEGIPFYRTKEIVELSKGNRITTELFITKERYDQIRSEYGAPQKGDLLISAVGTIGVIWIVDGKNNFYFKDGNLLRVSATEKFVPEYLKHLLEALISAYKSEMSSGTAYAALTISALKEMMVYDVPHAEQEQFAAFVEQTDKSKYYSSLSFRYCQAAANTYRQEWMTCRTSDF